MPPVPPIQSLSDRRSARHTYAARVEKGDVRGPAVALYFSVGTYQEDTIEAIALLVDQRRNIKRQTHRRKLDTKKSWCIRRDARRLVLVPIDRFPFTTPRNMIGPCQPYLAPPART